MFKALSRLAAALSENGVFRFGCIGALNTAFGYLVFATCVLLNTPPWLALAIAYTLGILFNFISYGRLVFMSSLKGRFLPYLVVYCVLYGINVTCLSILLSIGVSVLASQLIMVSLLAIISFFSLRTVFRDHRRAAKNEKNHSRNTLL